MNLKMLKREITHYYCPFCDTWHNVEDKGRTLINIYDKKLICECPIEIDHFTEFEVKMSESEHFELQYYIKKSIESIGEGKTLIEDISIEQECIDEEFCYVTVNSMCFDTDLPAIYQTGLAIKREFADDSDYDEYCYYKEYLNEFIPKLKKGKNDKEEEISMEGRTTNKATNIWGQLYEHSPKENVELLKQMTEKYKPTLKWVLPVVSIYAAYRILNSKESALDVQNIARECNKNLGFKLDALSDKKALKELMKLGGAISGAYAIAKITTTLKNKNARELTIEQIEEDVEKIEEKRNVFLPIVKKAEPILPVAISVIIVYLMTQKPDWIEKVKEKCSNLIDENVMYKLKLYLDMAKSFALDKLKIDEEDKEKCNQLKAFTILGIVVAISLFIYGKRIFGNKAVVDDDEKTDRNEKLEALISQLTSIMEKLLPTAFAGITTFLVTKNIIKEREEIDIIDNDEDSDSQEDNEDGDPQKDNEDGDPQKDNEDKKSE